MTSTFMTSAQTGSKPASKQIERNMSRQVVRGIITQEAMDAGIARIKAAPRTADPGRNGPGHRGGHRERRGQEVDLQGPDSLPEAGNNSGLEHLIHLDHPPGLGIRPPGPVHRPALHESRAR